MKISYTYFFNFIFFVFLCQHLDAQTRRFVRAGAGGSGTSWANANGDLQAMINASSSGDEVWVAAGVYRPSRDAAGVNNPANQREKTFLIKDGVKIYGGFAGAETNLSERKLWINESVLSGDVDLNNDTSNNAYHVILASTSTSGTGVVIDGFTVTGGTACGFGNLSVNGNMIARTQGAGMHLVNGNNILANNKITGNYANAHSGGASILSNGGAFFNFTAYNNLITGNIAISNAGGGLRIQNCSSNVYNNYFIDNLSATAGGAFLSNLTNNTLECRLVNNLFFNNRAGTLTNPFNGGAAILTGGNNSILHNTFYGNEVTNGNGGAIYTSAIGSSNRFVNNIFFNNRRGTAGNANAIAGADIGVDAYAANTFLNNVLQLSSADYTVANPGTFNTNLFQTNPLFATVLNPAGADGIPFTGDDGFKLQCNSALINAGQNLPDAPRDILGASRSTTPTIGALEQNNIIGGTPATGTLSSTQNQNGITVYGACGNNLIATVVSGAVNGISGNTSARVWVDATQLPGYVRRHYEISPSSNAANATGTITLYFTQADFDAYNALNTVRLPQNSSDAAGKANLIVHKLPGTSNNGTGSPASYSPGGQVINPSDNQVIWNSSLSRWEVTFNVTGFSGFFVNSSLVPLPVKWLFFNGRLNPQQQTVLTWKVEERLVDRYEVNRSEDGRNFKKITTIASTGDGTNQYSFTDPENVDGNVFYRVRQVDVDGTASYSDIIKITAHQNRPLSLYPNPAQSTITVKLDNGYIGTRAVIINMAGQVVQKLTISRDVFTVDISRLKAGTYFFRTWDGNKTDLIKK